MRSQLSAAKSPKTKPAKSQSPLTKKKLFKFVNQNLDSHEKTVQYHSKNDTISSPAPKEKSNKPTDFKEEIEKRFRASKSNREYVFPRYDSSSPSSDGSLASIKNAVQYDLHAQNFKRKIEKRPSSSSQAHQRNSKKASTMTTTDPIIKKQEQKGLKKIRTIVEDESPTDDQTSGIPSVELKNECIDKNIPMQSNFEAKMPQRAITPQYTSKSTRQKIESNRPTKIQQQTKPTTTYANSSNRYQSSFKTKREVDQKSIENTRRQLSNNTTELNLSRKTEIKHQASTKSDPTRTQLASNAHTQSAKTINVKLNLNLQSPTKPDMYESKTDRQSMGHSTTTNKKPLLSINNYGTVNNIINYNIYPSSTLQPVKSAKDLSINVSMPMKPSNSTTNLHAGSQTARGAEVATKLTSRPHQQYVASSLKASTVSTNDKSLQSFKSSIHSNVEKGDIIQKNNYVTPKVQKTPAALTLTSKTIHQNSTGRLNTDGPQTARENIKQIDSQKTSSLYQKTQKDILSKMTLGSSGTGSPQKSFNHTSSTYFPQTARNISKNNSQYLTNTNLMASPIQKMVSPKGGSNMKTSTSAANLKSANRVMTSSLKAINQSGRTSAQLKKSSQHSSTQKERPGSKIGTNANVSTINKSNSDIRQSSQYGHLNKLLVNNESRLSLNKTSKTPQSNYNPSEKPKMRLDLRSITKTSKQLYSDRGYHPLKSDRKDKSSEYYH